MKVSLKMKIPNDDYEFSEIRCLEKPFAIMLNSFKEGYGKLFYFVLKFLQCYRIKEYDKVQSDFSNTFRLQQVVLHDFFNIDLYFDSVKNEDINQWIEHKIDNNDVPFIFGNLRYLFYSKYYKKADWGHLFMIYGYDSSKQLFQVIDSSQEYKKEHAAIYKPFVIQYETLLNLYSNRYVLNDIKPCYLDCNQVHNLCDVKSIVLKCIEYYINENPLLNLREVGIIHKIKSSSELTDMKWLSEDLMRIRNAKNVFLSELIELFDDKKFKIIKKSEFLHLKKLLIIEWQKSINKIMVGLYKNQVIDIDDILKNVYIYENKMRDNVCMMKKEIIINGDEVFKEILRKNESPKDIFENNDDNIISKIESNNFLFNFPKNKVYPSFGIDDSPKVIIYKNVFQKELISLFVKMTTISFNDLSEFLGGIFLRTEYDDVFFWGNFCNKTIRLDMSGISNNISEVSHMDREVILFVKVAQGTKFTVGYKNEANVLTNCYSTTLKERIIDMGIGCKTWGKTNLLKVNYEVIS